MAKKITGVAKQRENWLNKATTLIRKDWAKLGVKVPADVQLSCGWPGGGSPRRRIGECWPRAYSKAKVNQVYVSPMLGDPMGALDVLGHELLHAVDNCESKHGHVFTKNSRMVGYSGGKHSAIETPEAKKRAKATLKRCGKYPHGAVSLPQKKQKSSNGLHKYVCEQHGDVLYSTAKTALERGAPKCRECGRKMEAFDRERKKIIITI